MIIREEENMTINKVERPIKPKNSEAKAESVLRRLLRGESLNREDDFDNGSLHSIISILRNEWYVPIESERGPGGTCNYHMLPQEIERFKNPDLRRLQINEMKQLIEIKRASACIERFKKLLWSRGETPPQWTGSQKLMSELKAVQWEINAILTVEGQERR